MENPTKAKGWAEIERAVEEAVKRALAKVKVPRREELTSLHARLDELSKRVEDLTKT
jgi:polyhydroxyalkanoate synthesis regulator phasin